MIDDAIVRFAVLGPGDFGADLQGWGPWSPELTPTLLEGASGGAVDGSSPLVWRVDLPAECDVAVAALQREDLSSRRHEAHSATAVPRLEALLEKRRPTPQGGVSFGLAGGATAIPQGLPDPERELWAAWNQAQASTSVSFGVGAASGEDAPMRGLVQMLTAPLLHLSRCAQIETRLEGRCIGRTTVSLGGDVRSILAAELAVQEKAVHQRSVAFVLQSRQAWVRSLLLTLNCALMLGRATTNPLSAARLVWMAAKYVSSITGEARLSA
jgi:hypothetical protein